VHYAGSAFRFVCLRVFGINVVLNEGELCPAIGKLNGMHIFEVAGLKCEA